MALQESGEMYLETLYILSQTKPCVHAVDICEKMGYSKPSVSRAMSLLKEGGYVTGGEDGSLLLTEAGLEVATTIYERHTVLTDLLMRIGVDEETAAEDACRIEHVISRKSFAAVKLYMKEHMS